jgi:L-threonylcarbamoyladenylate synthase
MRVSFETAVSQLKSGGVVAIPTETVYGLAARYDLPGAVNQVFALKQRPKNHPLIVHVADFEALKTLTAGVGMMVAEQLAKAFWPGPLTLVLPKSNLVMHDITGGQDSVAVRMPNHPLTLSLIEAVGALVAPSANRFTQLSPTSAEEVELALGTETLVLEGGPCLVGVESTIVSLLDPKRLSVLRPGMISAQQISEVAGLPCDEGWKNKHAGVKVPGAHLVHYAPKKPLYLFEIDQSQRLVRYVKNNPDTFKILLPQEPKLCARQLYSLLRAADLGDSESLCVLLPPEKEAWFAIRDRLFKAGRFVRSGDPL